MADPKYRNEWKFLINEGDRYLLEERLRLVLQPDRFAEEARLSNPQSLLR